MKDKNVFVKIGGRWYRITDMSGVDCINGEQYSDLFIDHIEDVKICGEGDVFQKQAQQQTQDSIDYAKIQADVAKDLFLMLASDTEKLLEQAVNAVKASDMFVRTLRKSIWKQQQDNGEQ
jgi:hypothetical protein